ncbi:MAG: GGDEF domain-containing phosphodiesterase [Proteobacteria bacterium]|nr:GGDEF domain-containing phosphodiesterase [Pseudomonadota bacterium]
MIRTLNRFLSACFFPKGPLKWFLMGGFGALLALCTWIVYAAGGTQCAYVHIYYFPILACGMCFGARGGLSAGAFAALLSGPLMPMDTVHQLDQPVFSWVLRGIFFMSIGGLSGMGATIFRSFLENQKLRLLQDPLTHVWNMRGLKEHAMTRQRQGKKLVAVLIEIKQLVQIDAALGPEGTQGLLRQICERLVTLASSSATVGHLETGGFVLLCESLESAHRLVEICRTYFTGSFTVDHVPVFAELHYGIAQADSATEPMTTLLRKAKIATNRSLELKRDFAAFKEEDDQKLQRSVFITHALKTALDASQLRLYYQPKVSLETGRVLGMEALVRWPHPEYGMIPPGEFVPVIETTLLVNPFTKWLIHQGMAQLAQWHAQGLEVSMSLNFSMANFQDMSLIEELESLVGEYSLKPQFVEIEVTETAVATNIASIRDILFYLRQKGYRIAVDDFGTGQSSLNYLFELPFDVLKIDQVFVRAMCENSGAEAIVRSALLLAKELNLESVAEGVENAKELDLLQAMGCAIGQGYHFARPMPAELATQWLKSHAFVKIANTHAQK